MEREPGEGEDRSTDEARDERSTEPPAERQPEHDPGEEDEGDSGPLGNPAQDEEALGNRQQER